MRRLLPLALLFLYAAAATPAHASAAYCAGADVCVPVNDSVVNSYIQDAARGSCRIVRARGTAAGSAAELRACSPTGPPNCCTQDTTILGVRIGETWVRVRAIDSGPVHPGPSSCNQGHIVVEAGGSSWAAGGRHDCSYSCPSCPPEPEPCPESERGPVSGRLLALRDQLPETIRDIGIVVDAFSAVEAGACTLAEIGLG